jgi:hypothetical protein
VDAEGFTQVFQTSKGKPLRVDYRILVRDDKGERARWAQVVQGTPFERFLRSAETEVHLQEAGILALRRLSAAGRRAQASSSTTRWPPWPSSSNRGAETPGRVVARRTAALRRPGGSSGVEARR